MVDLDGGLGGQELADLLHGNRRAVMARQAYELLLVAAWADVHNEDSLPTDAVGRVLPGMERAKQVGGDGTPRVAEFATAELAALLGVSVGSAQIELRDALDLRHRHPRLWARLCATATLPSDPPADPAASTPARTAPDTDPASNDEPTPVLAWQARKVAQACHAAHLTLAQARRVDEMTTPLLGALGWYRFEKLLSAAITQADPDAAAARARAEASRRDVVKGRTTEYGVMTLIIRANAGDVTALHATLHRLAHILALDGDTDPLEVRMAKATGILANPYQALTLLLAHATTPGTGQPDPPDRPSQPDQPQHRADPPANPTGLDLFGDHDTDDRQPADHPGAPPPGPEPPDGLSPRDLHPSADDSDDSADSDDSGDPGPPADRELHRALLEAIRTGRLDATKLLPTAVLYIHLSAHALHHGLHHPAHPGEHPDADAGSATPPCPHCTAGETTRPTVARGEDHLGPLLLDQVQQLLAHRHVTVKPVIDLNDRRAVDAYEIPPWMAEAHRLRIPGTAAPYSNSLARTRHHDHTLAYRWNPDGTPAEPGQTRPANLGPLEPFMHRVKTHARGWQHHQPTPGVYLWRTPHGYWYRVDNTGTHDLGKHPDLSQYQLPGNDNDS